MGVGQDDRWDPNTGDEGQTEDVGLPEHEDDEQRWQPGAGTGGDDPSDVAGLTDAGGAAGDLPEHEDDEQRWQPGAGTGGDDPSDVAGLTDVGGAAGDLPEHEDDSRRAEDTGAGEQNP